MKTTKNLLLAVLAFTAVGSAFADQWTKTFSSRNDATFQYQFFAHENSMFDSFLVKQDATLDFNLTASGVNSGTLNFGVYTFDDAGNILSTQTFDLLTNDAFSVSFNEGDRVGFWLDMGNGAIDSMVDFTNKTVLGTGKTFWAGHTSVADNEVTMYFRDRNVSPYDVTIGINGSAGNPSGQPLPGVLASLALGAAGLAYFKKRKKS